MLFFIFYIIFSCTIDGVASCMGEIVVLGLHCTKHPIELKLGENLGCAFIPYQLHLMG
jgi:hypothetical protein